jgi:hypothetical protein
MNVTAPINFEISRRTSSRCEAIEVPRIDDESLEQGIKNQFEISKKK